MEIIFTGFLGRYSGCQTASRPLPTLANRPVADSNLALTFRSVSDPQPLEPHVADPYADWFGRGLRYPDRPYHDYSPQAPLKIIITAFTIRPTKKKGQKDLDGRNGSGVKQDAPH